MKIPCRLKAEDIPRQRKKDVFVSAPWQKLKEYFIEYRNEMLSFQASHHNNSGILPESGSTSSYHRFLPFLGKVNYFHFSDLMSMITLARFVRFFRFFVFDLLFHFSSVRLPVCPCVHHWLDDQCLLLGSHHP